MATSNSLETAKAQLERVMGFFPNVDSKASVVLGVDVAMVGLLGVNAPRIYLLNGWDLFALLPIILVGLSLVFIYLCSFPRLEGGMQSRVYFHEIAGRTEAKYIEEFEAETEQEHINDLLGQIWRNSTILREKYKYLKLSMICLAVTIPFWVITLVVFALQNKTGTNLLVHP